MRKGAIFAGLLAAAFIVDPAAAQKKYDPGATDTEVKIGNTAPYSGPVAAASTVPKAMNAYFDKVNAEGGINGRKIKFLAEDDGYVPPKTVEKTRKMVEQDQVLFTSGSIGTAQQLAVVKYLNEKKVPQLFVATGAAQFYDYKTYPWSLGFTPSYYLEGRLVGKYIAGTSPDAKIAVLMQNDDLGKEYLRGLKETIGSKAKILAELTYEVTDPTVDSQIAQLKATGADTFLPIATQRFAALSIRRAYDTEWKPRIIVPAIAGTIAAVMQPAGLEKSVGVVAPTMYKDVNDPRWDNDRGMRDYKEWAQKSSSTVNVNDSYAATGGYFIAQATVHVLKAAGDNLTRENVLKMATNIQKTSFPMLLPGITVSTAPDNREPIRQMQFQRFNGKTWELVGNIVSD
jgi:branched-chain amino acid transport system substrate-binding protein